MPVKDIYRYIDIQIYVRKLELSLHFGIWGQGAHGEEEKGNCRAPDYCKCPFTAPHSPLCILLQKKQAPRSSFLMQSVQSYTWNLISSFPTTSFSGLSNHTRIIPQISSVF